jgi:hypothetical protein
MECRFSVEAKTFSFSVISGKAVLRLEEKRKRFGGFILLGGKGSVWLADKVEEAIGDPKKGEFASSFSDEVRVLKLRMGSNRAGWFLEAAVFVEGNRKGVIRLPEGRGGWGWRRFVEELRPMSALLVAKVPPAVGNADVGGKPPSYAEVLAAPLGGLKPACGEDLASVLGRWFSSGCMSCLTEMTELLRSQATEFLARMRAEVDRILFFGLGLKTIASRDVRKKLGRALSRLGLKHKLTLGWRKSKSKACGLVLRPKSLVVNTRVKPDDRIQVTSGQGQASSLKMLSPMGKGKGETSPEKTPVAQESTTSFDVGSVQMGCSELVPEMGLTSTEGVEESPVQMGSTQIVPETILTTTEAAAIPEKTSPEIGLVFSSMEMPVVTQRPPALLLEGSVTMGSNQIVPEKCLTLTEGFEESTIVLRCHEVPEPQLLVNGLTESQTWYLGWMRESTRCHEVLAAIDSIEVQTRRKNEVAPPPVCSMELPQLKAKLEAGIPVGDVDRETVVRILALSGFKPCPK